MYSYLGICAFAVLFSNVNVDTFFTVLANQERSINRLRRLQNAFMLQKE